MNDTTLSDSAFRVDVVGGMTIEWDVAIEADDGNVLRADVSGPEPGRGATAGSG
ncbi:hypothetical protein [Actinacidiphila acididurans]|uniref:PepSY domain-containing protein n=1 Tax=Actinacidiphila acididurans TaxID=2784346 RepID=A0ABS2TJB8_9ACTN|nr:hypothetical protein [Actinacidiphila acididurans]MBM9503157.1 hypothetical protein [Actinacidiphila acididurans]